MAKIWELKLNKGTLIETYSRTALAKAGTTPFDKTEKGLALYGDTSSYITAGNPSSLLSLTEGTIETWIKVKKNNSAVTSYQFIFTSGASDLEIAFLNDTSIFSFYIGNVGINGTSTIKLNTWYHIVGTWSNINNRKRIYVNGVLENSGTCNTNTGSADRYIGSRQAMYGLFGNIGTLGIWNNELTQQEINKLYADFLASKPISKPKRGFITSKPTDLSTQVNNTLSTTTNDLVFNGGNYITTGTASILSASSFSTAGAGVIHHPTFFPASDTGKTFYLQIYFTSTSSSTMMLRTSGLTVSFDGVTTKVLSPNTFYNIKCVTTTADNLVFDGQASTGTYNVTTKVLSRAQGLIAAYNMKPVNGILTDISGNGNNGTVSGGVISTKDGMLFNGGLQNIAIAGSDGLSGNLTISVKFFIKSSGGGTLGRIFDNGKIVVVYQSNHIVINRDNATNATSAASSITIGTTNTLIVTSTSAGVTNIYINGVLSGTADQSAGTPIASTAWYIANTAGLTRGWDGEIQDFKIYNRILTLQEITAYHNSFVKPVIVEDFSSEAADGTSIVPTSWQQISGTTKVGEINIAKGELCLNGGLDSGTSWTTGAGCTIGSGVATVSYSGAWSWYLSQTFNYTLGKTYRIQCDVPSYTSGGFYFSFGGNQSSPLINSTGHKSWDYTPRTGDTAMSFYLGSAAFVGVIDNISVQEIDPSLTVKQGTKYLEQVTAGILAIPSETAYGTWEFDLYKGADTNLIQIFYVVDINKPVQASVGNGYNFRIESTEALDMFKTSGSLFAGTAASYITNNTWYRIKITRSTAGVFTVLIKGGAFSPTAGYDGFTLVSVTGGSGTNPVTDTTYATSNYFVLDLDAGDRFTNLVIKDGIII